MFLNGCSQTNNNSHSANIDTLEFQIGYPNKHSTAVEQLKSYPSPRYSANNTFIRLFNWMNPEFMGGQGQPGITESTAIKNAEAVQEELILHWNYSLVIPNSTTASKEEWVNAPGSAIHSYINLANKYPQIPLGVTTFWAQLKPIHMGYDSYYPAILRKDYADKYYIKDSSGQVTKRVLNFAAPDSFFIYDGKVQKICIENIVKHLTRPIDIINENGEEPPIALRKGLVWEDKDMIEDKNKLGIDNWHTYISVKKKHFRQLYSLQFMDSIPKLKNTAFTIYALEGGPIDRFDWHSSKETASKIKGNYYSTPDFYPRKPKNWLVRDGAWHGWEWIDSGRKLEITDGDKFFSPFVAAGWAYNPEEDMRPAQWLGLLKCLNVVGAEFFYVGYFNLKQPFTKPEDYVWQAAMPAYSQAVATHFADVFFHGNVLKDENEKPIITYPSKEKDVLVTVRKSLLKNKYIIAITVQQTSNTEGFPLQKNVEITLDGEHLLLNARRQGSVYVYDKSVSPPIFYQLDRWHQYEHPQRWRKQWITEAEVFDTASTSAETLIKSVYLKKGSLVDFTNAQSFILLNKNDWTGYYLNKRDMEHLKNPLYIMLYVRCKNAIKLNLIVERKEKTISDKEMDDWEWIIYPLEINSSTKENELIKLQSLTDGLEIDKIIITDDKVVPDLKDY